MDPSWTPAAPGAATDDNEDGEDIPDIGDFVAEDDLGEDDEEELLAEGDPEELPAAAAAAPVRGGAAATGRAGPRAGSLSSSSASAPARRELSGSGLRLPEARDLKSKEQRKPRGNLPPAPPFSGDRRADPKCFKKYAAKVDSYVEIAKNIIDDAEIGLRLHAALDGDAADYLEDVPARTFGVEQGWRVLLKVLQDKFGETRMHQVSSAMRGFFKLDLSGKQHTMLDVMDQMDRAARRCREAELTIPDEIMIYFFFEHAGVSVERQANLLLRTEGKYNWRAMKKAVELLYMNVPVRGRDPPAPGRAGRYRQTHEVHGDLFWNQPVPNEWATEAQLEAYLLDFDPAERLAENFDTDSCDNLPEDVARELHTCFTTHRENRQRLAKAVQARGYYVGNRSKGKGKDKSKSKGKGKKGSSGGKSGGKARGMSLDELKAVTTCAECGQRGHWKGDAACPGAAKSAHATGRADEDEEAEHVVDYDDGWYDQAADQAEWESWANHRYGFAAARHQPPVPPTSSSSGGAPRDALRQESEAVARGVNRVLNKAGSSKQVSVDRVQATIRSDDYLDAASIKAKIEAGQRSAMSTSSTSDSIDQAYRHFGIQPLHGSGKSIMEILQEADGETIDVDELRRGVMVTSRQVRPSTFSPGSPARGADSSTVSRQVRHSTFSPGSPARGADSSTVSRQVRHSTFSPGSPARGVNSNMRRAPTVQPGRSYLTLDTACENTVAGTTVLQNISARLQGRLGLRTLLSPEDEQYCFGPGAPLPSRERWSVPVAVSGLPMVIHTSAVDDSRSPKIPFLAGQDWMVFANVCIDVGEHVCVIRELNVTVPLYIDVTGHLVIAIDEFNEGGWPQGLFARKDGYPGVLFQDDGHKVMIAAPNKNTLPSLTSNDFAPTHFYEPNNVSDAKPQKCRVDNDFWEFQVSEQVFIRHHRRPRSGLYMPDGTGPEASTLAPERVTVASCLPEPLLDEWSSGQASRLQQPWVGATYFFGKGKFSAEQFFVSNRFGAIPSQVHVRLQDGTELDVAPEQLREVNDKKVLHFDLDKAKPPDLPPSKRRGQFVIPAGEFGSRGSLASDISASDTHAQVRPRDRAMGDDGARTSGADPARGGGGLPQQDDAGLLAPRPSSDGVCQGVARQAGLDASDDASEDDLGTRADSGVTDSIPTAAREVQPPGGHGTPHGQRSREVHGVHPVRQGVESPEAGLPGADHERDDPRLPARAWSTSCSRRRHRQEEERHPRGRARLFGQLLLLLGTLFGVNGYQDQQLSSYGVDADFQDEALDGTYGTGIAAEHGDAPPGDRRHRPGVRASADRGDPHVGGGLVKPSKGALRRMQTSARQALSTARLTRGVMQTHADSKRWPRRSFQFDLVEIFAGSSMVTFRGARYHGMRVLQPIDLKFGYDLRDEKQKRWLLGMLDRYRPRLAVVAFPCRLWSVLQRNTNYLHDKGKLERLRNQERPFLQLVEEIFERQQGRGAHALAENPAGADSFREPPLQRLRDRYFESTASMCQYGLRGKLGGLMRKQTRFLATSPLLLEGLQRQCDRTHEHEVVEGGNTEPAGCYTAELADAICAGYWRLVQAEDFGFSTTWTTARSTFYVDVNREDTKWRPLLVQAQELLGRKNQLNLAVYEDSDLHKKVQDLVPWRIEAVQVAHLPKAKRVRAGLEHCHRASILLLNDDTIVIETELIKESQAPRERFFAPVRVAIFVLGVAPGEPALPSPVQPPPRQEIDEDEVQAIPDGNVVAHDEVNQALIEQGVVRQDFSGECWFVGPPLRDKEKKLARSLVRMHRNLGHPRPEDFARALSTHKQIAPEAVSLSRRLRCATCERNRRPPPPKPTSLKAMGPFNSKLAMDFVYAHDANGENYMFLHVLEPNGGFNVFYPCCSRKPEDVFEVFSTIWCSWAGFPDTIMLDQDGAFEGRFQELLLGVGTNLEHCAADSHWQLGEVESYNRAFQYAAAKIIDEQQLVGDADMKTMSALIGQSMNASVRTSGASANQWVFGKDPKVPVDLLSPDGKMQAMEALDQDVELRRRHLIRVTADAKIAEFKVNDALRRAVLRQGRPSRQSYEAGEPVAFWREARSRRDPRTRKVKRLPAGWHRGTIIGPHRGDSAQSNYWISSGGRCLLVSKEQLRAAYGSELWRIDEDALKRFLDEGPEAYEDDRGAPAPPDAAVPDYFPEVDDHGIEEANHDDVEFGEPETPPPPAGTATRPAPEGPVHDTNSVGTDTTQPSPLHRPGQAAGLSQPPQAKRLRVDDVLLEGASAAGQLAEIEEEDILGELLGEPTPNVPSRVLTANKYVPLTSQEYFARLDYDADFIEGILPGLHARVAYATTRKDQKALVREIPWHMIPEEQREAFREALIKEWGTWVKYEAVKALDKHASAEVEQRFPSRILPTRVCYRNKNAASPWLPLKPKARIVCRGDKDPDLLELRRDAPTLTRAGLMCVLQIACSMVDWFIFNADITGAFLQGDQSLASRAEALYLRQPREGLPGLVAGQLLLVVRGIFGLANSPRLFWRFLRDTLIKIGFVQSVLDKALFMYYEAGKLILVLGAHVDDLIGTGKPGKADEVIERIKAAFDFGAWADTRTDEVLEYGGQAGASTT